MPVYSVSMGLDLGTSNTAVENDVEVPDPPSDSISSLAFSPQADVLAAGSWDNKVRLYGVNVNGQAQGMAMYEHRGPVLSVCWNTSGDTVFSGGADKVVIGYDVTTGRTIQVAHHDAPVKAIRRLDAPQWQTGMLVTGSWDQTIKFWDRRSPAPIATVQLPERCYALDVAYPYIAVGTAGRHVQVYNINNLAKAYKTFISPLTMQTRVVKCFSSPAGDGAAIGSIEGRVAIQYWDDKDSAKNFSFRCHRRGEKPPPPGGVLPQKDQTVVYAVNDITFHPVHGTFSTCGSDGTINYWDKDPPKHLKTLDPGSGPISAACFNRTGSMQAYAISYDWHQGHLGMTPGHPNKLMLHACKDDEVRRVNKP